MKRYSIHTEAKDAKWIKELLSIGFDGYTIIRADGYWKGIKEKALEIVIYTDNAVLVRAMAQRIKYHNSQESVLVTETDCRLELI